MLQKWREFVEYYKEEVFKELISYIEKMWLATSTARRFLRCFTNHYRHFGQCANQEAKGFIGILRAILKVQLAIFILLFKALNKQWNISILKIVIKSLQNVFRFLTI